MKWIVTWVLARIISGTCPPVIDEFGIMGVPLPGCTVTRNDTIVKTFTNRAQAQAFLKRGQAARGAKPRTNVTLVAVRIDSIK